MTPRELIDTTATRGIALRVDGNGVRGRGLRKDERAFLAANAHAVASLLELDALIRAEVEQSEREQAELIQRLERQHRDREQQRRRDVMATWTLDKVVSLAERGAITAAEVRESKVVRAGLERRAHLAIISQVMGARSVTFR